ncbi:MAG: glycosyltransferase [Chloroflexi bacterium]|nr:glycosyltransferase [Chloroflexota bacterium]
MKTPSETPGRESTVTTVLIHADAGSTEGWGHLREALAVAKALRTSTTTCKFILPTESPEAAIEAEAEGFAVVKMPAVDWQSIEPSGQLIDLLAKPDTSFLVCDLVRVSPGYAALAGNLCDSWAIVTELREDERADVNFNVSQSPQYMPLGPEYRRAAKRQTRSRVRRILINYGGSDPRNITCQTLEMLRPAMTSGELPSDVSFAVVLGPLFAHSDAVSEMASSYPVPVEITGPLAPSEMLVAVAQSDIAISTAGGTMYEFCALGLPCIIVPVLDKHQANAKVLAGRGAVSMTSKLATLSNNELASAIRELLPAGPRETMTNRAQDEIDGQGAERIADRLRQEWGIS